MKKSRIALLVLTLTALAGFGFSAAGSDTKANAVDDCCTSCGSCASCCQK